MTAIALSAWVGQAEELVGTEIGAHAAAATLEEDLRRQALGGRG